VSASTCRSCDAAIRWVATTNDRPMPLDAEPNADGNVELIVVDGREVAVVHAPGQVCMFDGERWMPHFATCPNWGAE